MRNKQDRQNGGNFNRGSVPRNFNQDDRWFDDGGANPEPENQGFLGYGQQSQSSYGSSGGEGFGWQGGFSQTGGYGTGAQGSYGYSGGYGTNPQSGQGQPGYGYSGGVGQSGSCPNCNPTGQQFGQQSGPQYSQQPGYGPNQGGGFGNQQPGMGGPPFSQSRPENFGGPFAQGGYGRGTMSGREQSYPFGQEATRGGYFNAPGGSWQEGQPHRYVGRGPKGYKRTDERIREDVNDCLSDGTIDASDITVSVQNGEVTLSGTVESREMKFRAENMTERCSGVKDVNNQLRVNRQTSSVGGNSMRDDSDEKSGGQRSSSKSVMTGTRG